MTRTYERIVFDVQDGVATLTFNNPDKRNACRGSGDFRSFENVLSRFTYPETGRDLQD